MAVLPTPGSPISTGLFLRAPRQHLNHAADFLVATDHRVELALAGALHQIDAVLFQGLKLGLGVLVIDAVVAAHGLQGLDDFVLADGIELQELPGLGIRFGQRQQQMLDRDELVFHHISFALCRFEHRGQVGRDLRRRAAAGPRKMS